MNIEVIRTAIESLKQKVPQLQPRPILPDSDQIRQAQLEEEERARQASEAGSILGLFQVILDQIENGDINSI